MDGEHCRACFKADIPPVCIIKHLIFKPLACCSHNPTPLSWEAFHQISGSWVQRLVLYALGSIAMLLQEMNIGSVLTRKTILHNVPHMASNTVPLLYCVTMSFQTKHRTEQSSSSSSHSQHVQGFSQGSWCWTIALFSSSSTSVCVGIGSTRPLVNKHLEMSKTNLAFSIFLLEHYRLVH